MIVVAVGLVVTACSSAGEELSEQILESASGVEDVEIDEDTGQVSVETDEGSFSIGGGEVPSDFPFPFPAGYEVASVFEADTGSSVVVMYSYDRYDELASYVDDWTAGTGDEWSTSSNQITSAEGKEFRTANWFSDATQIALADNCTDDQGVDQTCMTVVTGG